MVVKKTTKVALLYKLYFYISKSAIRHKNHIILKLLKYIIFIALILKSKIA